MSARCDLTDLLVTECAHCRGDDGLDEEARTHRTQLLAAPTWFAAQYPGTCEQCGEPFAPGAAIQAHPRTGWRAECCGEGSHP